MNEDRSQSTFTMLARLVNLGIGYNRLELEEDQLLHDIMDCAQRQISLVHQVSRKNKFGRYVIYGPLNRICVAKTISAV